MENERVKSPLVIYNEILVDGATVSGDIVIPDGVKKIGECAFLGNTKVTSIKIPDSVTSIGASAFLGCIRLGSVYLPEGLESIEGAAFYHCAVSNINIPESVTSIGGGAFLETHWLEKQREKSPWVVVNGILIDGATATGVVQVPDDVQYIGDGAFRDAEMLYGITIPESVESVDTGAFYNTENLKRLIVKSTDCRFEELGLAEDVVIHGYADSTAEQYAQEHGHDFIAFVEPEEEESTVVESTTSKETGVAVGKTAVKSATRKKTAGKVKVSLKNVNGATGYKVQIAANKKFQKVLVQKKVKKVAANVSAKKLKKSKKLFVRARAYVKKSGTIYTGKWSKAKKVKKS